MVTVGVDNHLLPSDFEGYFAEISLVDIDNNVTTRYDILTKRPSLILPVDQHESITSIYPPFSCDVLVPLGVTVVNIQASRFLLSRG